MGIPGQAPQIWTKKFMMEFHIQETLFLSYYQFLEVLEANQKIRQLDQN